MAQSNHPPTEISFHEVINAARACDERPPITNGMSDRARWFFIEEHAAICDKLTNPYLSDFRRARLERRRVAIRRLLDGGAA